MSRSIGAVLALAGPFLLLGAGSASADGPAFGSIDPGLGFELRESVARAVPPLPDPGTFPIQLVLDDDSAEGDFGLLGPTARQFLWLNRFDDPGAFFLEEIWVLFPGRGDVPVGGAIDVVVFRDPDGDPTNGAELLATYAETVQAADGNTFSVYALPSPLELAGGGDVLIGVVNRYYETGVDPPPTLPAAFDGTTSQQSSYFALWPGDVPDPIDLTTASSITVFDGVVTGNFMIRGFGRRAAVQIPTLGTAGAVALGLLLALLGASRLRGAVRADPARRC